MYRIGLTGGIATGKSTVSKMLRALGAEVIDADIVARQVVEVGQPAYAEIVEQFGSRVLRDDGAIDRVRLGELVFADQNARQLLNQITHPRVIEQMESLVKELGEAGYVQPVVLDVPLLVEADMSQSVDEIWLVMADEDAQIKRLKERNGLDREAALARIHAQMPLKEKAKLASQIINNNGTIEETFEQVKDLWVKACQAALNCQ